MRVIEKTLYELSEMDDRARARALDDHRFFEVEHDDWFDSVFEDTTEIGALLGIEIDRIYFSGFSSQGDGACFEGVYRYRKGWRAGIKDWIGGPDLPVILDIGERLQEIQRRYFYSIEASVRHHGRYCHEHCTDIRVTMPDHPSEGYWNDISDDQKEIEDVLRDFMRWIYRALEREYDHLTSDEVVAESLEANGLEFEEDGTLVP